MRDERYTRHIERAMRDECYEAGLVLKKVGDDEYMILSKVACGLTSGDLDGIVSRIGKWIEWWRQLKREHGEAMTKEELFSTLEELEQSVHEREAANYEWSGEELEGLRMVATELK